MPSKPEASARANIDAALLSAEWLVQNFDQLDVSAAKGVAVREFPLERGHGFADYALYFDGKASSTSGLSALSVGKISGLPVPLPPQTEQSHIVAQVEDRLSIIDAAEAAIRANSIRSSLLRQAVLHRAFEGKLVAQDTSDEPASALLERLLPRALPARRIGRDATASTVAAKQAREDSGV